MSKSVLPMFFSRSFIISGLTFRSLIHFMLIFFVWYQYMCECLVMSDSLPPCGLQPARLLCPWNSSGKNIGVGCHALLQGIFLTQGSNPRFLYLWHWQVDSLPLYHLGSPIRECFNFILLHIAGQFSQILLIEEIVFSPLHILASFVIEQMTIACGFTSRLSILFH